MRLRPEPTLVLQAITHFQQLAIMGLYVGPLTGCLLIQGDGRSATYPGNSNCDIFDLLVLGISGHKEHETAKMSQVRVLWYITILD